MPANILHGDNSFWFTLEEVEPDLRKQLWGLHFHNSLYKIYQTGDWEEVPDEAGMHRYSLGNGPIENHEEKLKRAEELLSNDRFHRHLSFRHRRFIWAPRKPESNPPGQGPGVE